MSQSKLDSFGPDHIVDSNEKVPVYDCQNCQNQKGFAGEKVHCLGRLKEIPANGCSSWTDGNDLAYFPHAPEGFVPRKWT